MVDALWRYNGESGMWERPGWQPVAPGGVPIPPDTGTPDVPIPLGPRLQVLGMGATALPPVIVVDPGGGGGVPTDPPAPTGTSFFGTEPNPAGTGTAPQLSAINKMGTNTSVRQYVGTNWTTLPAHRAGVSVVQTSYSPRDTEVLSGSLDNAIAAIAAAARAGDILTYAHESDNKGYTGATLANRIGAMNRFYDVIRATNPAVHVAPTFTGYMFSPKNGGAAATQSAWANVKGTLLGADMDGVHADGKTAYYPTPDYRIGHVTQMKNFMARNATRGWQGWTVPEHMTARITSFDPTGSKRASWFDDQMSYFQVQGVYACMIWDFPRPPALGGESSTAFNVIPNPSPELTVIRKWVASNPASA